MRSAEIVLVADEHGAADCLGPLVFVFAGLARKDEEPDAPVRQHVSLLDTQDLWSLTSALPSAATAASLGHVLDHGDHLACSRLSTGLAVTRGSYAA